jgi:hypothetical protein
VNRTTVQSPTVLPWRSRRVVTRRRSSLTGSCADRRTSVLRSTITFTPGTHVANPCRCSKSAVSFGRTTISTATSGNDREGRSSRSWSTWPAQMLCVTPGSSSGSRSPRSPGFPSRRHHAQTTFILGSAMLPLACHPTVGDPTCQRRPRNPEWYARELTNEKSPLAHGRFKKVRAAGRSYRVDFTAPRG